MREQAWPSHVRVETADYTDDGGYRATVRLLRSAEPPTAIFAVDDVVCLGARAAAAEFGVDVPGALSLVGYDNSPLARLRSIWLTSVDCGGAEVGGVRPARWRPASTTRPARAGAPARACAAGARHHRPAPLTRAVCCPHTTGGLKAF